MMFQFPFKRLCTFPFYAFVVICSIIFTLDTAGALTPAPSERAVLALSQPEPGATAVKPPIDVDAICLFTLRDGICEPQFYDRSELAEGRPLKSRGHVVGVVVFGPGDLKVRLDGRTFRPLRSDADGTFLVKGFGKIDPADHLAAMTPPDSYHDGSPAEMTGIAAGPAFRKAHYYFPKVYGDAVSPSRRFELQLVGPDARRIVEIDHQPVQAIDLNDTYRPVSSTAFHYIGSRLERLSAGGADFNERLTAIAEGIQYVENAFQMDLVQNVQLIDLNQKNNALTFEGRDTVWFYIDTVLGTTPEELRYMARHEALHQLVYRLRLTEYSPVRKFFADLWGLEDLGVARFQLVTTGWFDARNAALPPSGALFFAFINEKNFIQGLNGGHSHDNLDEFLTSFIHSLLYVDRLDTNLHRPVKTSSAGATHRLKEDEKGRILKHYRESIELLMQTVGNASSGRPDPAREVVYHFFRERLATADLVALRSPP